MPKITKVPNRDLYRAKVANPLLGHDNNGRVKRQVIYGKTMDEVKQKITELEMEILNGRYVGVHNVTVEVYLNKWLEKHKKDLKPTTYSRYHDLIEKHIVPILGNTKLQGVTKAQVVRMYNVLLTEGTQHKTKRNFCPNGLSYRSVQQIHRVISHACKDATEGGLLKNNPCTGALPKCSREAAMQEAAAKNQFIAKYLDIENPTYRVNRTMEMNEITAFIEFLKITNSTMYFPALLTIGLGGLRRGELLAATWKQVFFEEKRFVVARSLSFTTEERLSVELPKSASSIRVVPIPDSLVTVM